MKLEFETTLKGSDVTIIGHPLTENQEIQSIECNLKWSIDPTGGSYGIKFWNCLLHSFSVEMIIQNSKGEEEKVQFDSHHLDYNFDVDMDDYHMSNDFMITEVEIDKSNKTVVARINPSVG